MPPVKQYGATVPSTLITLVFYKNDVQLIGLYKYIIYPLKKNSNSSLSVNSTPQPVDHTLHIQQSKIQALSNPNNEILTFHH